MVVSLRVECLQARELGVLGLVLRQRVECLQARELGALGVVVVVADKAWVKFSILKDPRRVPWVDSCS